MSPITRRHFLAAATAFSVAPALHASPSSTVAARRAAGLQRGVNLSGWFGGWGEYSAEHIATWTTAADLAYIKATGLQYVRLCVDPSPLTASGSGSPEATAALARLDHALDEILAAGLNVLVTVFPRSDYKRALLTPAGASAYFDLWNFLATHFRTRDVERVFFDLMNEPEIDNSFKWGKLQAQVVDVIRAVDSDHTLIATGCKYAGIDELLDVEPLKDPNVLYVFHFYEPFPFTHQGATWGSPEWTQLKHVPYPADPERLGPMIAAATDPAARNDLSNYSDQAWDAKVIRKRLETARKWADKHAVTVICNEFGAFRDTIAVEQRAVYLHDVRAALESLNIPWAMWDYRGNFGMVQHDAAGAIVPDLPIIQALGLTPPPTPAGSPAPTPVATPATSSPGE